MNIIATDKKWDDILPQVSSQELVQMLHGLGQKRLPAIDSPSLPHLVLFYGNARENKAAAAALMAAQLNQPAYRIDLSFIVSKYIGETEKNLNAIFDKAENSNWILFFDEADALFGKRTDVKDSHDRYAGEAISYLLQRIEKYENLVILATNNKVQVPSYILRRFQTVIHFPDGKKE